MFTSKLSQNLNWFDLPHRLRLQCKKTIRIHLQLNLMHFLFRNYLTKYYFLSYYYLMRNMLPDLFFRRHLHLTTKGDRDQPRPLVSSYNKKGKIINRGNIRSVISRSSKQYYVNQWRSGYSKLGFWVPEVLWRNGLKCGFSSFFAKFLPSLMIFQGFAAP